VLVRVTHQGEGCEGGSGEEKIGDETGRRGKVGSELWEGRGGRGEVKGERRGERWEGRRWEGRSGRGEVGGERWRGEMGGEEVAGER